MHQQKHRAQLQPLFYPLCVLPVALGIFLLLFPLPLAAAQNTQSYTLPELSLTIQLDTSFNVLTRGGAYYHFTPSGYEAQAYAEAAGKMRMENGYLYAAAENFEIDIFLEVQPPPYSKTGNALLGGQASLLADYQAGRLTPSEAENYFMEKFSYLGQIGRTATASSFYNDTIMYVLIDCVHESYFQQHYFTYYGGQLFHFSVFYKGDTPAQTVWQQNLVQKAMQSIRFISPAPSLRGLLNSTGASVFAGLNLCFCGFALYAWLRFWRRAKLPLGPPLPGASKRPKYVTLFQISLILSALLGLQQVFASSIYLLIYHLLFTALLLALFWLAATASPKFYHLLFASYLLNGAVSIVLLLIYPVYLTPPWPALILHTFWAVYFTYSKNAHAFFGVYGWVRPAPNPPSAAMRTLLQSAYLQRLLGQKKDKK